MRGDHDRNRGRWWTRRAVLTALATLGAGCSTLRPGSPTPAVEEATVQPSPSDEQATVQPGPAVEQATVQPGPSDEQFTNPGRGWVLTGLPEAYDGADDVFPYASLGYTRFSWSQIQHAGEGEFDWDPIDDFVEGWDDRGMTAAFGVYAANSHSGAEHPFVTPEWVFDAGAEYKTVELTADMNYAGTPGTKVVPDFDHPVFLEKLRAFVEAMADRYDDDERVEFVDISSYGNWGETHMWPFDHLADDMYDPLSVEAFVEHVRIHTEAFDETQLLIPSKGADHEHSEVDAWALDHGVGLRRNGVIASSDGSETRRAFGEEPAAFEWHGDYEWLKSQGYWDGSNPDPDSGFPLDECVERGKPTYVGFNQYGGTEAAQRFLENEKELIEDLSQRIGYRFELVEATIPTTLPRGQSVELAATWRNVGVAPMYVPAHVAVALIDSDDQVRERQWLDADPTSWMPESDETTSDEISFDDVESGEYRLAVGMFTDRERSSPDVRLASETERVDRWHVLGDVELV